MVSPASSTPRPPAPSVQQATALPGKCPPTRTTDNDGVSHKVSDHCWITGSGRITHSASAEFTYTGTPPSRWLHSTCAPYMYGWLATMAMTGPSSATAATASSSTKPDGSHNTLPASEHTSFPSCPIPNAGELPIATSPSSTTATCDRMPPATSCSRVAHCCPSAGTHCRSSAQIAQTSDAVACSTPQVLHTQNMAQP